MSDRQRVPLVMIVEDQPANMLLARAAMQRGGFGVVEARDGDEMRVCLASARPDLILMDIGLPGQDGLSLTRELKSGPLTADIPVIALTAHAMQADRERAQAAGCDGYLSKPFSPRELVDLVQALLEDARLVGSDRERTQRD